MFLINNISRGKKQGLHAEQFIASGGQSPAVFCMGGKQLRNKGGKLNKRNIEWSLLKKGSLICIVNYSKKMVEIKVVDQVSNDEVVDTSVLRANLIAKFKDVKKYSDVLRDASVAHRYITEENFFITATNIIDLEAQLDDLEVVLVDGLIHAESVENLCLTLGNLKKLVAQTSIFSEIISLEEISLQHSYVEGGGVKVYVNRYERNKVARQQCIEHYGAVCRVCKADMEKIYGEIAFGFIHVHHLKPLSEIGCEYEVDPINDLVPLCPNCHAMIHRKNPPYTILEMSEFVKIE
jgi:5-methylcytosine-specific restriction protein A